MKTRVFVLAVWGAFVSAAGLISPGCVSVSTPKKIEIGAGSDKKHYHYNQYEESRKISKGEACTIARDKAINKGVNLQEYDIHDKNVRRSYWVLFERKNPEESRTWRNHFAVRVSIFGWSTFYKPSARPGDVTGRTISKKEAYAVARRLVESEGAKWDTYEIQDKEIHGDYWILFETTWYKKVNGWKNHFAVRVSRYGETELYK